VLRFGLLTGLHSDKYKLDNFCELEDPFFVGVIGFLEADASEYGGYSEELPAVGLTPVFRC
jgi:hypothetical protein